MGNTSVKTFDIILFSLGLEIEFKTIRGFGLPNLDELYEHQKIISQTLISN